MPVINTNLLSLKAQYQSTATQSQLNTTMERLSSGLRVNSAADDAAAQAIANRFEAQKVGLGQGARNANDGISMSQTAQGVLDSINDKLQRVRELTVQGLNGTNQNRDSDAIQAEINQNLKEIDRLASSTEYNGIPLLNGTAGDVSLQIGANDGETLNVDLNPPGFSVAALGLQDFNVAGEPGSVTPRDTLYGPADDIVLDDYRTTVNPPQKLYALGDVSLAGDHQLEGDAIINYYVSAGPGNYSRVDVSATHETATDLSEVNITNHQPIYKDDWGLDNTLISNLAPNQKVVKGDDTYYVETNGSGVISYREVTFNVSFDGAYATDAQVSIGDELVDNYQNVSQFEFSGDVHDLNSYRNVEYRNSNNDTWSSPEPKLVEDQDNSGSFYLKDTSSVDALYYRLDAVTVDKNLDVKLHQVKPPTGKVVDSVIHDGVEYDISGGTFDTINYNKSGSGEDLVVEEVVESYHDSSFYAVDGEGNHYKIENISGDEGDPSLQVSLSDSVNLPVGTVASSFSTLDDVEIYDSPSSNYDNLTYTDADADADGDAVDVKYFVEGYANGESYVVSNTGDYYIAQSAVESEDIFLRADEKAFSGVDVEGRSTSFEGDVKYTPNVLDFSSANDIMPDNLSRIISGSEELVRRTSDDHWIIRGELPEGGYGYFRANLDVELDGSGNPVSYTATATQPSPTILGVDDDVVEKVHGISTVTIDPRNVSVEYTDIEGRTYSDVLTEGEDGNYYFELPGESSLRGGYKTATLVDHDQEGEIILRTENGASEVVVYYPTELEKNVNRAFFVQTDGDGFSDTGAPHTRLRIQEVGEDFRIQMPRNPLAALDRAIGMVDSKRSHLGAMDNRLSSAIEGNDITRTNLASAQSRLVDADYAKETANMVKLQIMQQAGTSVLAQANIVPEVALALLGDA